MESDIEPDRLDDSRRARVDRHPGDGDVPGLTGREGNGAIERRAEAEPGSRHRSVVRCGCGVRCGACEQKAGGEKILRCEFPHPAGRPGACCFVTLDYTASRPAWMYVEGRIRVITHMTLASCMVGRA